MRHDLAPAVFGQGLQDYAQVGIIGFDTEYGGPAHAVQRLEDHILMLPVKRLEDIRRAADQRGGRALRELLGEQFLIAVAQALRFVHYQYAFAFGLLQQVGAVDELAVERRILAHQDHIQLG